MEGAISGRRLLFSSKQPPALLTLDKKPQAGHGAQTAAEGSLPFMNMLRAVLRRKRLILTMAGVGGAIAGSIGFLTPPTYVATAQIVVDVRPFDVSGAGANPAQGAEEAVIDTHVTVLSSDAHLRRVVSALHAAEATRPQKPPADSWSSKARAALGHVWSALTAPLRRNNENLSPEAADIAEMAAMKRNLRIGQERRSRIVNVVFSSNNPAKAAEVVNTVAQIYVEDLSQRRRGDAERIAAWLAKRVPEVRQEVANAEEKLEAYRLVYGIGASSAPDETGQQIAQLSRQLALAKLDAANARDRFDQIADLRRRKATIAQIAEAAGSDILINLARREKVSESGDEIDKKDASSKAEEEIAATLARFDSQSHIYEAQVKAIEDRLQLLKGAARETASGSSGLRALERQASAAAQIYDALLRRQQEVTEQVQFAAPDARVLALAWTPERPSSINPLLLIPPTAIVFGLFGVLLAVGFEFLDHTLHGERETAEALETPCVGVTPKIAPHHANRIHDLPRRQLGAAYAQAIRSLLASVLNLNAGDRMPKIVLVTSSNSGEGKTTLAYSLAIFVARLRWRVLLLDFSRHTSPAAREFRSAISTNGVDVNLAELMQQGRHAAEAVRHIREIEVDYVPPPKPEGDLLKLLASPQATLLLEQLSDSYDLIIVDGPSLLDGPEASILAKLADQVLLAIKWGSTTRGAARLALERINNDEAFDPDRRPRVACVLTQVDLKRHVSYGFEDSGDVLARALK